MSWVIKAEEPEAATVVVVLNDGETYSDIAGCMIVTLTAEGLRQVEEDGANVADLIGDPTLVADSGEVK